MNKKRNILFTLSFSGVFALAFVAFVVIPNVQGVFRDANQLASLKQELLSLKEQKESHESFAKFSVSNKEDLDRLSDLFLDPSNPTDLLAFLEQSAQDSQLTLTTIPGAVRKQKEDPWPALDFQLSLEGSFPNAISFLKKIENGPYLLEFQSLNLSQERQGFKTSISLKAYTK